MPSPFGKTPESLLQGLRRSDSKNPLTTCHGITASGRPCRRALAEAVNKLNAADDEESSVVAVLEENEIGSEITAFFCWQHKDQADSYHVGRAKVMELKTRGSLEEMLSNMGLQDADEIRTALSGSRKQKQRKERRQSGLHEPRTTVADQAGLPSRVDEERPYNSDSDNIKRHNEQTRKDYARRDYEPRRRKTRREPSFWDLLCGCVSENDADVRYDPPARQRQRQPRRSSGAVAPVRSVNQIPMAEPQSSNTASYRRHDSQQNTPAASPVAPKPAKGASTPNLHQPQISPTERAPRDSTSYLQVPSPSHRPPLQQANSSPAVVRKPLAERPTTTTKRWISADDPISATPKSPMDHAMTVIPRNASMKLASDLMAEMSKIEQDTREGYIYIYWLTSSHNPISGDAGGSLLADSPRRNSHGPSGPAATDSVLLKIGRTDNVHRRLNQWQLQCGYQPLLVRSYPSPQTGVKVKHVHRVERLIHVELGEKNVKWDCTQCGREHREWFEVKGRDGVREVDHVVQKWVEWGGRWDAS
ncbi:DUF1766-domain-containing protein [Rhizodiscina lignyota]|uniref:DUF1766-domain-containing protein n=1 Tax=Rhizodiscina lignyota TaxID=1504668 RepID=A0A9P4I9P9_9PEZI|nr:DUF1766-domain-containing protein [Rhizodiscina lignyota]